MKKPLVYLTLSFMLGIVFSLYLNIPAVGLLISLFASAAGGYFFLNRAKVFFLHVLAGFFLMGAVLFSLYRILPEDHIKNYTTSIGQRVVLKGTVITEPVYKKNKSVFVINAEYLKLFESTVKVSGKVLVWCFKNNQININEQIIAQGKLYKPYPFNSARKMNYRDYLMQKGIYSQLSISGDSILVTVKKRHSNVLNQAMQALKRKTGRMVDENLSASASGIIRAMILGDRSRVPDTFNKELQRSGTVHVLAVSGLHTGFVIIFALVFLKMFSLHYRLGYILIIVLLGFYCWFTGNCISVLRATIMGSVFLLGEVINREYDPLSALSLSALIILWINPADLFDAGFQLSFLSVLSIFILSARIIKIFPEKYKNAKVLRVLVQGISVSLGAWIGTAGIVAYYFNIFTPVSVLANLIIIPLLFLIILSALLFIFLGMFVPAFAPVLALNCEFFVVLMYKVNSLLIAIPGAYVILPDIALGHVFLYYCVLLLFCMRSRLKAAVNALQS
ncbi:MAG: ComEC/Rec2 family competence protein [Candidatus Omnitrophota bacterium]